MSRRTIVIGPASAAVALGLIALVSVPGRGLTGAALAQTAAQAPAALELSPAQVGATYTGSKRCSSCHFKEYMVWKKTGHATGFAKVPAKYYANADCMKCHITGYGVPGGYQGASTPDLVGTTCEACHGPGSKHEEAAKPFTNKKELSEEEKKLVNSVITRKVTNVCAHCHLSQAGHQEHPAYDKQ